MLYFRTGMTLRSSKRIGQKFHTSKNASNDKTPIEIDDEPSLKLNESKDLDEASIRLRDMIINDLEIQDIDDIDEAFGKMVLKFKQDGKTDKEIRLLSWIFDQIYNICLINDIESMKILEENGNFTNSLVENIEAMRTGILKLNEDEVEKKHDN